MKPQLPITSSVDELQINVRSRNPSTLSIARQNTVSLEQPPVNFQPGVQSMGPNIQADHQSPTLVSGENISSSSDTPQGLQELDGSTSPCVCTQCGCILSYSEPPPSSDPLVLSTAQHLRSNITASEERSVSLPSTSLVDEPQRNVRSLNPFYWSMTLPLVPPAVPDIIDSMPTLQSLLLLATAWNPTMDVLRDQSQYRTSQGQISNPSQYQNPHIIPAEGNHDMRMDINSMSYEELLALEEMIGKVNTGVKTFELSKFVKEVIYCGEQDEAERCVICLEPYVDADAKGQLKCGHEYHFSCIGKWMEEQAVCPICRQRVAHIEQ